MQIHILNGPNLNLIGKRQPEIYGTRTLESHFEELKRSFPEVKLTYFQSNFEGALIDRIHEVGFDATGIVLNPGGLTHTSVSLMDAVSAVPAPVVEVHISDIYSREPFRWHSYVTQACVKSIVGRGLDGYQEAIEYLLRTKR